MTAKKRIPFDEMPYAMLKAADNAELLTDSYSPTANYGTIGRSGTSVKIVANVDVGFGNRLYIRGDGCGLSWDKGIEMTPIDGSHWQWICKCRGDKRYFDFKVLVNDDLWSVGENYVAIGEVNEVTPSF
jgi:hypothetical protein